MCSPACCCVCVAQCWPGHHCLFGVHASTPAVEAAAKLIGPVFFAELHFPSLSNSSNLQTHGEAIPASQRAWLAISLLIICTVPPLPSR
jgi:hypothetical protein